MAPSLEILPWAVVRGAQTLRQGAPLPVRELFEPLDAALERHGRALLWDMEGIEGNRPRLDLIKEFEGQGLWVDTGVRYAEGVIDVLVAGAAKAVVGTKSLWGLAELEDAFRLTENVLLQIDYAGRVLHPGKADRAPTPPDLARWVRSHGGDTVLLVTAGGLPDLDAVRAAAEHARVFAGIATAADLPALEAAGAAGAVADLWEVAGWTS